MNNRSVARSQSRVSKSQSPCGQGAVAKLAALMGVSEARNRVSARGTAHPAIGQTATEGTSLAPLAPCADRV